jgi:hypothetical protein
MTPSGRWVWSYRAKAFTIVGGHDGGLEGVDLPVGGIMGRHHALILRALKVKTSST